MNPMADAALNEWGGWVRLFHDGQGFGGGVGPPDPSSPARADNDDSGPITGNPVLREVILTDRMQGKAQRIQRHIDKYPRNERRVARLAYVGPRLPASSTRAGESQVWRTAGEIRVARGVRWAIRFTAPPEVAGRPWVWGDPYRMPTEGRRIAEALDVTERHARRLWDQLHERLACDLMADRTMRKRREAA